MLQVNLRVHNFSHSHNKLMLKSCAQLFSYRLFIRKSPPHVHWVLKIKRGGRVRMQSDSSTWPTPTILHQLALSFMWIHGWSYMYVLGYVDNLIIVSYLILFSLIAGVKLECGKQYSQLVERSFHISHAALQAENPGHFPDGTYEVHTIVELLAQSISQATLLKNQPLHPIWTSSWRMINTYWMMTQTAMTMTMISMATTSRMKGVTLMSSH